VVGSSWVEVRTPRRSAISRPRRGQHAVPAALGIPTLDGLGADGRGAHALDEQIKFSSLVPRVQLLVRLMETLR